MPIVHIQILEGRSREKKRTLIRAVSRTVAEVLEVPLERVRVILQEVDPEHWGIGGETAGSLERDVSPVPANSRSPP